MALAHREVDAALEAGRRPIVVGGTGLYLRAALAELSLVKVAARNGGLRALVAARPATRRRSSASTWTASSSTSGSTPAPRRSRPPAPSRRPGRAEATGPSRTARKALGFDELLAGDVELMKRRSRNYARRQLTWMRKIPNLVAIDRDRPERRRGRAPHGERRALRIGCRRR